MSRFPGIPVQLTNDVTTLRCIPTFSESADIELIYLQQSSAEQNTMMYIYLHARRWTVTEPSWKTMVKMLFAGPDRTN